MENKPSDAQGREESIQTTFPTFETDLFIPQYQSGQWESWEIRRAEYCLDHGYVSGTWMLEDLPVLLKRSPDPSLQAETWMSPSAYEIESQELGCRNAGGHTVVAGLGLGWSAINAALLPQTNEVTVLELDPLVISIIEELQVITSLPSEIRNKLTIVQTDAMDWRPGSPVDFLYADIWAKHGERSALEDVRKMQDHIQAKQIYFWGQELLIYHEAKKLNPGMETISNAQISQAVEQGIELPLFIPRDLDYAQMINRVITNRINRGLPLIR